MLRKALFGSAAAVLVCGTLILAGCSASGSKDIEGNTTGIVIRVIELPSGGYVTCATSPSGSIDCDWVNVKYPEVAE